MLTQFKNHSLQKWIFLVFVGFLSPVFSFAQGSPNIENIKLKWLDIAYATTSPAQKLDVYLPEGNGPFPVILSIHGGAFKGGDKRDGQLTPMLEGLRICSCFNKLPAES
ncbi:MAG TPA: hypothetical protein VFC67_28380 [Prolixibacteraceae bacterium]|nr:hypothetical protein [Prolixibacteraceae bacterium]